MSEVYFALKSVSKRLRRLPDPPTDEHGWIDLPGVCSICGDGWTGDPDGGRSDELVTDHCHRTGFVRGRLCRSCNTLECKSDNPVFVRWRLTAPRLAQREQYGSSWGWVRDDLLTTDELRALPIAELLDLHEQRRFQRTAHNSRACADAMERILTRGAA
jgi:hypothetical protein